MKDRRRITIFDTTLRDGEQSPGIALSPDEKAEIALALERLGVDVIEAGFACSSPGDFEGVRAVGAAVSMPTIASFARAKAEDLDAAVEALAVARGRTRIHVALGTSPIHMTVDSEDGLESALEEALDCGRTVVVDARVDAAEHCFPMIPAGAAALDLVEYQEPEPTPPAIKAVEAA